MRITGRGLQLLAWLLTLSSYSVCAQEDPYRVKHYTINDGLPQSSVTSINFDRNGYCWLGTEAGLVRFDGHNFKTYGANEISGLQSERVRVVARDIRGAVYARTAALEHIVVKAGTDGKASYPELLHNSDVCVLSSAGYAIPSPSLSHRFSSADARTKHYQKTSCSGAATGSGDFYLQEGNRQYFVHKDRWTIIDSVNTLWNNYLLVNDVFVVIMSGQRVSAWKNGIRQPQLSAIKGAIRNNEAYKAGRFTCYNNDEYSYIYAGNTLYHIYIKEGSLESRAVLKELTIPTLSAVYYHARRNEYYLGSLTSGLYIVSDCTFRYPGMPAEAVNDGFYAQAATSDGKGVISQRYLFNIDHTYRTYPVDRLLGPAILLDKDRYLYYGNAEILKRFDIRTGMQQNLWQLDSRLSAIIKDNADSSHLWVSTVSSLYRIKKNASGFAFKTFGDTDVVALKLVQTGKDSFLIGTTSGLKWYDFKRNRFYRSLLNGVYIQSIYRETPDRTWISSQGKGLFLYEKNILYKIAPGSYPALKTVHAIIEDGRGLIWLTTNSGLYTARKTELLAYARGTKKELFLYSFTEQDGLRNKEFNGGCTPEYVWLRDSMLSVPSIAGLAWFYPHRMQLIFPDNNIFIDGIEVDNKATGYSSAGELNLEADFSMLKIMVSAPYFGNKENIRLTYNLKGLDTNWRTVPENGELLLNRIPPGTYQVVIRVRTGLETSGYCTQSISLTVAAPFYRTWWFNILLVSILGLLGLLLFRFRTKLLQERNRKLQDMVREQTRDLNTAIIQLTRSEQQLKESHLVKDKVIRMVLHDLRSPMKFLYLISKDILSKYKEMAPPVLERRLKELKLCIGSLNDFAEQFFTWANSQHPHFRISEERFALQQVFDEVSSLYKDIALLYNNELIVTASSFYCRTDRQLLSAIIRNLVDNANKNTRNGKIVLSAQSAASKLIISVKDTGRGFQQHQLQDFLNTDRRPDHSGNGSLLVLNLLQLIGGELDIETQPGAGSAFSIILPHHC